MGEICTILRVVCSRLRNLAVPNNQKASSHVILTYTPFATINRPAEVGVRWQKQPSLPI